MRPRTVRQALHSLGMDALARGNKPLATIYAVSCARIDSEQIGVVFQSYKNALEAFAKTVREGKQPNATRQL